MISNSTYHLRRVVGVVIGAVVAMSFTAQPAWAKWTATGTGPGRGVATSITAPTVTVPSTSTTNVSVNWSGATGPAGQTLKYFVERMSGSTPTAACGSTFAAPITGTSCTDSGVGTGSYTYRVTTRFGTNWSAVSAQSSVVGVGVITTLTITSFTAQSGHAAKTVGTAAIGTTGDALTVNIVYCGTSATNCASPLATATNVAVNQGTGAFTDTTGNLGNNATVFVRVTQVRTAGTLADTAGPITV